MGTRLRHQLKRLEQVQRKKTTIWLLRVDERGIVLDDNSGAIGPFVGKHSREVPGSLKFIVAVDRLEVRGQRGAGGQ